MCAVTFSVSRRFGFFSPIDAPVGRLVSFVEGSSSDDLPVTGGELRAGFTNSFPLLRHRGKVGVVETRTLGPDPGVEDADDDVVGVIGVGPETEGVS